MVTALAGSVRPWRTMVRLTGSARSTATRTLKSRRRSTAGAPGSGGSEEVSSRSPDQTQALTATAMNTAVMRERRRPIQALTAQARLYPIIPNFATEPAFRTWDAPWPG